MSTRIRAWHIGVHISMAQPGGSNIEGVLREEVVQITIVTVATAGVLPEISLFLPVPLVWISKAICVWMRMRTHCQSQKKFGVMRAVVTVYCVLGGQTGLACI